MTIPPGRPPRPYDNKVQSLGAREPRQAWGEGNPSDELVTNKSRISKRYSKTIVTHLYHERTGVDNQLNDQTSVGQKSVKLVGRNLYLKEVTIVLEHIIWITCHS